MKKVILLAIIFAVFSFLQACNETSIEPIQAEGPVDRSVVKERLERTAWVMVSESDNAPDWGVGTIVRFFPNGTFWESREGDETSWKLSEDGKSVILQDSPAKTLKIKNLTDGALTLESSYNGGTYTVTFSRQQEFSQTKYMLSRTSWRYVRDGATADTLYYTFNYHDILKTHRAGDTKLVSTPYSLKNNETVVSFDPIINSNDQEITALTTNYLKLKDTQSGEEIMMWARW
jgi:hypothetical protein